MECMQGIGGDSFKNLMDDGDLLVFAFETVKKLVYFCL